MPTIQHVKGSEIQDTWLRKLSLSPEQYYNLFITLDQSGGASVSGLAQAVNRAKGIWKNRPNITEEMTDIRQEFDRNPYT